MKRTLANLTGIFVTSGLLFADTGWPNWRGPSGHGVAESGKTPAAFGPEKGVAWKVKLPGRGGSTPMVLGDLIVVTAEIDGKDGVLAVDKAGKEKWRATIGTVSAFRGAATLGEPTGAAVTAAAEQRCGDCPLGESSSKLP
jgi:hypothetical protein